MDLAGNLDYQSTVLENVMKDSAQPESLVRTILARFLFKGGDVYKEVARLSGGEKVKLSEPAGKIAGCGDGEERARLDKEYQLMMEKMRDRGTGTLSPYKLDFSKRVRSLGEIKKNLASAKKG